MSVSGTIMKHIPIWLLTLAGCIAAMACSSSAGGSTTETTTVIRHDTATYTLPLPVVPSALSTPEARADFVVRHYWDAMDWSDTLLLASERFMGESMATFGTLLQMLTPDKATPVICAMVNAAAISPRALDTVNEYAYDYFYYPDAPQYDPELYLLFVNTLVAQPGLDMAARERLAEYRRQILKNRVGERAADFKYVDSEGRTGFLLSTRCDVPFRMLILYDPDCNVCDQAVDIITSAEAFTRAQHLGQVAVVAVNAFGQEVEGPALRKDNFPSMWTVGYSPEGEIDNEEIYIIRATPAIYILDSNGTILEKDLSLHRLTQVVSAQE